MRSIEQEGKNVENAVNIALDKLGVTREKVNIEVLDAGSPGLLGIIGAKNARVRVSLKEDQKKKAKEFLEEIISCMDVDVRVEIDESQTYSDQVSLNITGKNLGIVIGKRGQTLDALQYLTGLAVNKDAYADYTRVLLDAEGYRDRRKKTLERLAIRLARKAQRTDRRVVLEPMPPHERRIIHITLQEEEGINTYSEGVEPYRKVIITAE
ncbi:MAG: RNA-binding cell elongation regulator Jag/EloR [Halanaerobium sp.]|nr:RNA-binding cell elongation regulator Jag/EloR [Halanaerobium sp.]